MIKAKKLHPNAVLTSLDLNSFYIANAKNGMLYLSRHVKAKGKKGLEGYVPVKVKKIIPPNNVEVEILNESFTVVEEAPAKMHFSIKSDIIEKLAPEIKKALWLIRQAVNESRLIIVRHHADCDGYCGALALEEVLLPIIERNKNKPWLRYRRLPMTAPYYDYSDALKDLTPLKDSSNFNRKNPLLIIVDNGSGEEDLLALKRIKQHSVNVVIIDHHVPSEEVDNYCDVHINPRKVGGEGDITAGMLCFEIANQLGKANPIYAALSGVADKSEEEFVGQYLKLVKEKKDFLEKLVWCVDFEVSKLRFMESNMIKDLFNEKQEETIKLLWPKIDSGIKEYKKVIKKYLEVKNVKNMKILKLNLEKTTVRGGFPKAGKIIGIAHRMFRGPRVTIGEYSDAITFRVDGVDFKISEIKNLLKKKIPHGMVSGGGHDYAGTIRFLPVVKEEVVKVVMNYINKL